MMLILLYSGVDAIVYGFYGLPFGINNLIRSKL